MNNYQQDLKQSLAYPGIYYTSEEELPEEWWTQDSVKDLDDEKFTQICEEFLSREIDTRHMRGLVQVDTLLSWIFLRLRKRIDVMKKVIEENWNGAESSKQVDKLEHIILNNLKLIDTIIYKQYYYFHIIPPRQFNYVLNHDNGFESLLFYSDNLDINYYVLKIIHKMYYFTVDSHKLFQGHKQNQSVFQAVIGHFLIGIRDQFPFIVELYKTEKFFKEVPHKPENMDPPNDIVKVKTQLIDLNVQSIKKEFGEYFHSLLATRQLLEKEGIRLPNEGCDQNFLKIMLQLRTFKNFSALKQRAQTMLCMMISIILYNVGHRFPNSEAGYDFSQMSFDRDLRMCLSLKNFPLQEYYSEMLEIYSDGSFYGNEEQSIDLSVERRFVEDTSAIIEKDVEQIYKRDLYQYIKIYGLILTYGRDLSYQAAFKNNQDKVQEDFRCITNGVQNTITFLMKKYCTVSQLRDQQGTNEQQIGSGAPSSSELAKQSSVGLPATGGGGDESLSQIQTQSKQQLSPIQQKELLHYLIYAIDRFITDQRYVFEVGDVESMDILLDIENSSQSMMKKEFGNLLRCFYTSSAIKPEFELVNFSLWSMWMTQGNIIENDFTNPEFIAQLAKSYKEGNWMIGRFAFYSAINISFSNFYQKQIQSFEQIMEILVDVLDKNIFINTQNIENETYLFFEHFYNEFQKNILSVEQQALLEKVYYYNTVGLLSKQVISNIYMQEDESQYYDQYSKTFINKKEKIFENIDISLKHCHSIVEKDRKYEKYLLERQFKENPYNNSYVQAVLSINSMKSKFFITNLIDIFFCYVRLMKLQPKEIQFFNFFNEILFLIHPTSSSLQYILYDCLKLYKIKPINILIETGNGNTFERPEIKCFINMLSNFLKNNLQKIQFFPFELIYEDQQNFNYHANGQFINHNTYIRTLTAYPSIIQLQQAPAQTVPQASTQSPKNLQQQKRQSQSNIPDSESISAQEGESIKKPVVPILSSNENCLYDNLLLCQQLEFLCLNFAYFAKQRRTELGKSPSALPAWMDIHEYTDYFTNITEQLCNNKLFSTLLTKKAKLATKKLLNDATLLIQKGQNLSFFNTAFKVINNYAFRNNQKNFQNNWPKDLLSGFDKTNNINLKEAGHQLLTLPHKIFKLFKHRKLNSELDDMKQQIIQLIVSQSLIKGVDSELIKRGFDPQPDPPISFRKPELVGYDPVPLPWKTGDQIAAQVGYEPAPVPWKNRDQIAIQSKPGSVRSGALTAQTQQQPQYQAEQVLNAILYNSMIETAIRQKMSQPSKICEINVIEYLEKMLSFLRSCDAALHGVKLRRQHYTLPNQDMQQHFSQLFPSAQEIGSLAAFNTMKDIFLMYNLSVTVNGLLYNFSKCIYYQTSDEDRTNFVAKLILEPNEDRYRRSSKLFIEMAHQLLILDYAFFTTNNEYSLAKVGGQLIQQVRDYIQKKKCTYKKIDEKMNYFSSNLSLMMRERIEKKLNVCKLAETQGSHRLAQLADNLLQIIANEVMCSGIQYPIDWATNIAEMLRQCFMAVAPTETRQLLTIAAHDLSRLLIGLIRKFDKNFSEKKSHLLTAVAHMRKHIMGQALPKDACGFIRKIESEIQSFPPAHTPAVFSFLFALIDRMVGQKFALNPDRQKTNIYVVGWQQYLTISNIFTEYFGSAPTDVRSYQVNALAMMDVIQYWTQHFIQKLFPKCRRSAKAAANVLDRSAYLLQNLITFADSKSFKVCDITNKYFILINCCKSVIALILFAISTHRFSEKILVQQTTLTILQNTVAKLMKMQINVATPIGADTQYFCQLYTLLLRLNEVLFTFQKDEFLKSNYEIRIKGKLYDPVEKRFMLSFSFQQLAQFLDIDLLESGRILGSMLINLIEGFEEDPEIMKKFQEELLKAERLAQKKDGEEGEEAVPPPEEEKKVLEEEEVDKGQQQEGGEEGGEGDESKAEDGSSPAKKKSLKKGKDVNKKGNEDASAEQKKPVFQRKLKLIHFDKYSITTSKILKLTQGQKAIIDDLVQGLEDRVLLAYEQCKLKSTPPILQPLAQPLQQQQQQQQPQTSQSNPGNQQQQSQQQQQLPKQATIVDDAVRHEVFQRYALSLTHINQLLLTLMRKYPLTIPYILEKKLKAPEFTFLKKSNILTFIDYIILLGPYTCFELSGYIELLSSITYCFPEEEGGKHIPSSWFYARALFDRSIIWMKRLIEKKDFLEQENYVNLFFGLQDNMLYFLQSKATLLGEDRIKRLLSMMVFLFKKPAAANACFRDFEKLDYLKVPKVMADCLRELLKISYKSKVLRDWDETNSMEYIKYYVNRNFLLFFDKEKREALGLEKAGVIDFADILSKLSSNVSQNIPKVIVPRYAVFGPGNTMGQSMMAASLLQTNVAHSKPLDNVGEKQLDPIFQIAFEQQFQSQKPLQYISSITNYPYEKLSAGTPGKIGPIIDIPQYLKYRGKDFKKREHSFQFFQYLNIYVQEYHLKEIVKPFTAQEQEFMLGRHDHKHLYAQKSLIQIIEDMFFVMKQKLEQKKSDQQKKDDEDETKSTSSVKDEGSDHYFNEVAQSGKMDYDSDLEDLLESEVTTKQTQKDVKKTGSKTEIEEQKSSREIKQPEIIQKDGQKDDLGFNFVDEGFPENAIELYKINLENFKKLTRDQKYELLKDAKKKYLHSHKQQLHTKREILKMIDFFKMYKQSKEDLTEDDRSQLDSLHLQSVQILEQLKSYLSDSDKFYQVAKDLESNDATVLLGTLESELTEYLSEDLKQMLNTIINTKNNQLKGNSDDPENYGGYEDEQDAQEQVSEGSDEQNDQEEVNENENQQMKEKLNLAQQNRELEQQGKIPQLDKQMLTPMLTRDGLIEDKLGGTTSDSLVNLASLIPTMDDEFIIKLLEKLHLFDITNYQIAADTMLYPLLDYLLLNPYNSYRFLEAVYLLSVNNIQPRQAFDHYLLDIDVYDSNLQDCAKAQYNAPIILPPGTTAQQQQQQQQLLLQQTQMSKKDAKFYKTIIYFSILKHFLSSKYNLIQILMLNFPLAAKEEYSLMIDDKMQTTACSFIPFALFKDFKFTVAFKALAMDSINMFNFNTLYLKWLNSEKKDPNSQVQSLVIKKQDSNQSRTICLEMLQSCIREYYLSLEFIGEEKHFARYYYPHIVKPISELSLDYVMENLNISQAELSQRLNSTEMWVVIKILCRKFPIFLDFSKRFFALSVNKFRPQIQTFQQKILKMKDKLKKQNLDNLNSGGHNVSQYMYQFDETIYQGHNNLYLDISTFSLSLIDIFSLFNIAFKNELASIKNEYYSKKKAKRENYKQEVAEKKRIEAEEEKQRQEEQRRALEEERALQKKQDELERQKNKSQKPKKKVRRLKKSKEQPQGEGEEVQEQQQGEGEGEGENQKKEGEEDEYEEVEIDDDDDQQAEKVEGNNGEEQKQDEKPQDEDQIPKQVDAPPEQKQGGEQDDNKQNAEGDAAKGDGEGNPEDEQMKAQQNKANNEEAQALQMQKEREEEEALDKEIDYSEEDQWYKDQKKLKREELINLLRQHWVKEDKSLVSYFADILEMIYTCITFCWQPDVIYHYYQFSKHLECLLIIYQFLYEEKKDKKSEVKKLSTVKEEEDEENSISPKKQNEEEEVKGEGEGEAEAEIEEKKQEIKKKESKDLPIPIPTLSKIMSLMPDENMLESMNVSASMVSSIQMFRSTKKNIENVTLVELYEIMKKKMVNLIGYFINSSEVFPKKCWIEFMQGITQDKKNLKKLTLEMKISHLRAAAKNEAKNLSVNQYSCSFQIKREEIWNCTLAELMKHRPASLVINSIQVNFDEEEGIDAGGLTREWMSLSLQDLLDPRKGLFRATSNLVTLQPNPNSSIIPGHLTHFRYAGRLIAKGIIDNLEVNVDFTRSFLKHLLKKNLYINDLEDIDPDVAQNLIWLLQTDITDLDLGLTFQTQRFYLGVEQTIDLIPNGRKIFVTNENKKDYIRAFANWKMTDEIKEQLESFTTGFYEVIPFHALQVFNEKELGLMLSGVKTIDLNDLKANISLSGYSHDSPQIQWLWEVLEEFDQETRALFLFFITGSFKVPFGGFKNLRIDIGSVQGSDSLPVAHTCSKALDLPNYISKEQLRQKLIIALNEGNKGFYIG